MAQEQLRFLLINYSKTLGKYNRVKYPKQVEKTIRGNALITVPKDYIDEFNISHSLPLSIVSGSRKSHTRKIIINDGFQITKQIREHEQIRRQGKGRLTVVKKMKAGSGYLNPEFQLKKYHFRFPYFFNISMIDQALFSILKNDPQLDRLYFFINGKEYELTGEETGWGTAKLSPTFIESNDHISMKWGGIAVTKI